MLQCNQRKFADRLGKIKRFQKRNTWTIVVRKRVASPVRSLEVFQSVCVCMWRRQQSITKNQHVRDTKIGPGQIGHPSPTNLPLRPLPKTLSAWHKLFWLPSTPCSGYAYGFFGFYLFFWPNLPSWASTRSMSRRQSVILWSQTMVSGDARWALQ